MLGVKTKKILIVFLVFSGICAVISAIAIGSDERWEVSFSNKPIDGDYTTIRLTLLIIPGRIGYEFWYYTDSDGAMSLHEDHGWFCEYRSSLTKDPIQNRFLKRSWCTIDSRILCACSVGTLGLLIMPLIRFPLTRWRRIKQGLCLNCEYDVKGNESGICPECGTPIPLRQNASANGVES